VELYFYVKNKLGEAILEGDEEAAPYKDRFFKFMRNQYNFYINNDTVLFFLEQYNSSPYAKHYPEKDNSLFTERIIPFFNYGIDNGYFKNIDSRLLWPTIRGTLVAAASFRLSEHIVFSDEDIQEVITIIWDGIKKQ